MLLSAVSVLVVAQSSSEVPEGLMNNPVFQTEVVEKIKTQILCSVNFFNPENRAVYQIMWKKKTVGPDRPQVAICRMCFACNITKATDINSE